MGRYLAILRRPGTAVPFTAAYLARLPISMIPLGIVLLLQDLRGSYGIAGLVTAAFALGTTVSAPALGRAMDRLGQPRVLLPTGILSAAALVALDLSAVRGASDGVLLLLSAACGLFFPPISPAMRSAWRTILTAKEDLRRAYAMDVVAVESAFFSGPLLLSGIILFTSAAVPLMVTAGLLGVGTVVYGCSRAAHGRGSEVQPRPERSGSLSLARLSVLLLLLLSVTAMSIGFGHLDVAFPATARELLHSSAWVGAIYAPVALGSMVGGLWFGSRRWTWPTHRRLPLSLMMFTGWLGVLSFLILVPGPRIPMVIWLVLFLPALVFTGATIAPSLIMQQSLVDDAAPADRLVEAQAWLSSGLTAGGALGAAAAGVLIDLAGPGLAYVGATGWILLAVLGAVVVKQILCSRTGRTLPATP